MQAYSRAHRMGQKNNVTVYRFLSETTLEEKIDKMQKRKLNLANGVLAETATAAAPTDEELRELLQGE